MARNRSAVAKATAYADSALTTPRTSFGAGQVAYVSVQGLAKVKGSADLHSMAAWENLFILKQVMEAEGVAAKPDTLQADRSKIRDGLAKLKQTEGLLGVTKRTEDREAEKPYLFVHAKNGQWVVLHNPL